MRSLRANREAETGRYCGPYDYDELQDIAPKMVPIISW